MCDLLNKQEFNHFHLLTITSRWCSHSFTDPSKYLAWPSPVDELIAAYDCNKGH